MKRTVWLILAIFLSLFLTESASMQQKQEGRPRTVEKQDTGDDDEVVKLDTELVSVPFSVTDKRNRYITDLKQEEIVLLEDGKQQEIFSFTKETDLPLTFAILLDISGSQELTLPAQKDAAYRFLEKVIRPDRDLAAIVTFRKDVEMLQGLTSNLRQLKQALNSVAFNSGVGSTASTPPWGGASYAGTSLFDSIYVTTDELLEREAGRRVIIVLTDGRDTTSSYSRQKAIERAWKSEVIVYAIGIQGMGRYGGQIFTEDIDRKTLQKITEETGGRLFAPKNESEYDSAFRQIEEDLRQQYIISYSPSNEAKDGSFRNITVKIVNRDAKDLKVLHRKGYFSKKS